MHKKYPKHYPEMEGRKPYAWGAWVMLLIFIGWLLVAWLVNVILNFLG